MLFVKKLTCECSEWVNFGSSYDMFIALKLNKPLSYFDIVSLYSAVVEFSNLHALQYFFEKSETFKVQTKYSFSFRLSLDEFQFKF